jgi:hypothetical protein
MDFAGTGYNNLVGDDFPKDVIVLDSITRVVNETFEKAAVEDGLYNHHVVFTDGSKRPGSWLACNGKAAPEMPLAFFMGAGSEDSPEMAYSADVSKIKAGFYIGKNDIITNMIDIVNYHNRERTVYTISEMEYLPGKPEGWVDSQKRIVPMGMCDGMNAMMVAGNIHPPTDGQKKFVLSGKNDIEITRDGYLVGTCMGFN